MKKLSKVQVEKLDELHDDAKRLFSEADDAWSAWEVARDRLIKSLEEAGEFVSEWASDAQGVFDDRSEKWQDSDAGQAVSDWIDQLNGRATELSGIEPEASLEELDAAVSQLNPEDFPVEAGG